MIRGRFIVRHYDGLTAVATRFDLAALVVVAGFVADRVED
jgi:hypothetical protein